MSSSGSPLQLSSTDPSIAEIDNGRIKPLRPGTTKIVATLPANANYFYGGSIERALLVTKGSQTITFPDLAVYQLREGNFELTATATSGLPVTYKSSNPSVATVTGSSVTMHSAGTTILMALQSGNDNFFPPQSISQVLVIIDGTQSISFRIAGTKTLGDEPFNLAATASSNLDVVYASSSDKIIITGSVVTILKAGVVTIQANQNGNVDFKPAVPVEVSFCINPPRPVIRETGQWPDIELQSSNTDGNQWYLDDILLNGYISQSVSVQQQGSYTVSTSIEGCESERSSPMVFILTAAEDAFSGISLYPNPAIQTLYVEIPGNLSGKTRIELLNSKGVLLESREVVGSGSNTFNLQHYASGLLFVKIMINGEITIRKVMTY